MRNVLLIGMSVFLAVIASLWCVMWYTQAKSSEDAVKQFIARVNATQQYLTYDSLETSGFPTHVEVKMVNPKFNGRIDTILKSFDPSNVMFPSPLPQWQENMALDGTATFKVNALSDHYEIATEGSWTQDSTMNGALLASMHTESFASACKLIMDKGTFFTNMWSFKVLDNKEEFFKKFRKFDCAYDAYAMNDKKTGVTYMASGPMRFYVSSKPQGDVQDIHLFAKYDDLEITQQGENLITSYIRALSPDSFMPAIYYVYGKQDLEMNLSFKGVTPLAPNKEPGTFEMNLGKLHISNDVYNMDGHFLLRAEPMGENQKITINTNFDSAYTEKYEEVMKLLVWGFINHAANSDDPLMADIKRSMQGNSPEEVYTMVAPAIPRAHELGTMKQKIEGVFEGNKSFTAGSLNLAALEFSATPYGIMADGSAKTTEGSLFPEAYFTVKCRSCNALIDDTSSYVNRIMKVMQNFNPENPQYSFTISAALADGVKQFLGQLSTAQPEESSKGNLSIIITSDTNGQTTIGGRNIMEVMQLFDRYVGQKLAASTMPPESMPVGEAPPQGWQVQ